MPPVIARPCSIDLWQLRSHSAISLSPTQADMIARFDADVPFSHRVRAVRAEDARGVALALADRAAVAEHRAERAALDAHVGAKQVLAEEVEEHAADRRFQERDAALVAGRGPRVLALAVVARQRGGVRRQQRLDVTLDRGLHAARDERRRVVEDPDELVGQRRDFDADRARELAAGHQEDRHLGVARAHGAQQLGRLFVRARCRCRPASSSAGCSGCRHRTRPSARPSSHESASTTSIFRARSSAIERAHAASGRAARFGEPAVHDERSPGHGSASRTLHHCAFTKGVSRI